MVNNKKYKEISHSHYKLGFNKKGSNWEEILKNIGREMDNTEHKISPSEAIEVKIKSGEVYIQTISCYDVDMTKPVGEKVKSWNEND